MDLFVDGWHKWSNAHHYYKNRRREYYLIGVLNGYTLNMVLENGFNKTITHLDMNLDDAKVYVISYSRKEKIKNYLNNGL